MSGGRGKRPELRLVGEEPAEERVEDLGAAVRALAGEAPLELDLADNEALLAIALGDDALRDAGDDELRRATALGDALDRGTFSGLCESLKAAYEASELDPADNEALLAIALGEDAVTEGASSETDAELVEALRAARGGEIDALANERLIRGALRRADERRGSPGRRGMLAAALAVAAGVALVVASLEALGPGGRPSELTERRAGGAADMIHSRSTAALFDPAQPFAVKGGESERVRRIVASRAADLRENRFAAWGVR